MRVLFISDVYFPRVNGVSTSIRTFREDLARCGVETTLVAPEYGVPDDDLDPDLVRVRSAGVPGDPEDRRMRWSALKRALRGLSGDDFDLIHIHTPFVAHYAGVWYARRIGSDGAISPRTSWHCERVKCRAMKRPTRRGRIGR